MIGLRDLRNPAASSWAGARAAFSWPAVTDYNIALDCLRSPRDDLALVLPDGAGQVAITYGRLDDLSDRLARVLADLGVGRGDRVAVKLPQCGEMAVAVLGALKLAAVVVTVSNILGDDAILHRLADSGARVLICAGDDRECELARQAGVPVLAMAEGEACRDDGWLDAYQPMAARPATRPDDPALILYTSGTTGSAKGVLHGHRVLLGHHAVDVAWDHVRPGDVAYSPVDWSWAGGLLLGLLVPLAYGMTVVAFRDIRFDPERTVHVMRGTGVSVGLFPPTALRALHRSGALTGRAMRALRLRCLITGAEAVEPELVGWAREELGLSINNAFGQTEANALIGHSRVLGELDPGCLGRPYPGHDVAILDPGQRPVQPGVVGEIAVRADDPVCMLRYWNAPEATADKIRDGWLLTGDSAQADADGNLYFHGRGDDIIKSGGYRIGPAEIEAALLRHPGVAECAAIGVPDPARGQAVKAYVVLATGFEPTEDLATQLRALARGRVGAHAYPRQISYVPALPRTTTGKVDRRALRMTPPDA